MILVALDSSSPASAVALACDGEPVEARHEPAPGEFPGHAARLLELAAALLGQAGLRFADLDRIAVGTGPGTYTGLRIGIATAYGLARSSGATLLGISSLRALAAGAAADGRTVIAVRDARRGEAFIGVWDGARELVSPRVVSPEEIGAIARPGWLAVGDGALRFRDRLEGAGTAVAPADSPAHGVQAAALCRLVAAGETGQAPVPEAVLPAYLRQPDAERR